MTEPTATDASTENATDWRAVDLLDDEGMYPTDAALDLIRSFSGTPQHLVTEVLAAIFDSYGHTRHATGTDDFGRHVIDVHLVTGGWSGCEEAIGALKHSMFWFAWWESSRRGGAYTFQVPAQSWNEPMHVMPKRPRVLDDTVDIAEMTRLYGHEIRTTPTTAITARERALRPRMIIEEALEYAAAMGCVVTTPGHDLVEKATVHVDIDPTKSGIDLVEATDALGDLIVVTKGAALTNGIPVDQATEIIHGTNMAKVGPDGSLVRGPDGKVGKPEGWQPPTVAIRDLLVARGWDGESHPTP